MKKIKSLLILGLILSMTLMMSSVKANGSHKTVPLIAGQYDEVGLVEIWNDGDYLFVKYVITKPGLGLTETHLHVGVTLIDFPLTKNGSPKIGNFDYKLEHAYVAEYMYTIPLDWAPGDEILVAAHAVVESLPLGMGPCPILPEQVTLSVTHPHPGGLGYFQITISGGTTLDGIHPGWCIDVDNTIATSTAYTADVYCSYDPAAAVFVENPENFDLVNWILNQDYIGQVSPSGGVYAWQDVQQAIWQLLDEPYEIDGDDPVHVQEIKDAATAYGEGFVPECWEYVAIVLVPVNEQGELVGQPMIIKQPRPCDYDETAWGDGDYFNTDREEGRGDWSMYIRYTITEPIL